MPKVTLDLSDDATAWIREKVEDGAFPSESAYVEALVRWQVEALDRALQEGIDSGISDKTADEIWEEALKDYRRTRSPADA